MPRKRGEGFTSSGYEKGSRLGKDKSKETLGINAATGADTDFRLKDISKDEVWQDPPRKGTSDNPQTSEPGFIPVDEIPDPGLNPEEALLAKERGLEDEGGDEELFFISHVPAQKRAVVRGRKSDEAKKIREVKEQIRMNGDVSAKPVAKDSIGLSRENNHLRELSPEESPLYTSVRKKKVRVDRKAKKATDVASLPEVVEREVIAFPTFVEDVPNVVEVYTEEDAKDDPDSADETMDAHHENEEDTVLPKHIGFGKDAQVELGWAGMQRARRSGVRSERKQVPRTEKEVEKGMKTRREVVQEREKNSRIETEVRDNFSATIVHHNDQSRSKKETNGIARRIVGLLERLVRGKE